MNSRGQAFVGYRLLIGTIIALLILTIIVGAIDYLQSFEVDVSTKRLYSGLQNAAKQPNNDVLIVENLVLGQGAFTSRFLAGKINVEPECLSLSAAELSAFSSTGSMVEVHQRLKTNVFIRCRTEEGSACPIACELSFGENFDFA